jgi:hypothetical protein
MPSSFDEMPEDFTVGDYFNCIKPARTPRQDPNRIRSGKPRPPPGKKPSIYWPTEVTKVQQAGPQQRKRKISTQVVAISPLDTSQIAGTSADAEAFEQGFFLEIVKKQNYGWTFTAANAYSSIGNKYTEVNEHNERRIKNLLGSLNN